MPRQPHVIGISGSLRPGSYRLHPAYPARVAALREAVRGCQWRHPRHAGISRQFQRLAEERA
jgi:hypothetical protein